MFFSESSIFESARHGTRFLSAFSLLISIDVTVTFKKYLQDTKPIIDKSFTFSSWVSLWAYVVFVCMVHSILKNVLANKNQHSPLGFDEMEFITDENVSTIKILSKQITEARKHFWICLIDPVSENSGNKALPGEAVGSSRAISVLLIHFPKTFEARKKQWLVVTLLWVKKIWSQEISSYSCNKKWNHCASFVLHSFSRTFQNWWRS